MTSARPGLNHVVNYIVEIHLQQIIYTLEIDLDMLLRHRVNRTR